MSNTFLPAALKSFALTYSVVYNSLSQRARAKLYSLPYTLSLTIFADNTLVVSSLSKTTSSTPSSFAFTKEIFLKSREISQLSQVVSKALGAMAKRVAPPTLSLARLILPILSTSATLATIPSSFCIGGTAKSSTG